MEKKDKKPDAGKLTGEDVLISVLVALAGSVVLSLALLIGGALLFPDVFSGGETANQPAAASQSVRGTLPSRAPTQTATPTQAPPDESDEPSESQTVEPTQEPQNQTVPPTQSPATSNTQAPSAQTNAPAATQTQIPAAQNPGPAVSVQPTTPTAPPEQQTQAPAQSGNTGTVQNNDGTYTHDFSGGRMLGTVNSDKYHYYDCRAAKKIPPENCVWYNSESEAKAAGRNRCGICWR